MKILGLSFDFHDSAAALVVDGVVVAAAQEERFSRVKNDPSLPVRSVRECLAEAGVRPAQLDYVVFYEKPITKFDRILKMSRMADSGSRGYLDSVLERWLRQGKFDPRARIARELGIDPAKIVYSEHHLSHACAAFFCSPFERATVITLDGVGEYETATTSIGDGLKLKKIAATRYPDSLGLLYSAFTAYLGFEINEGEYKVMGMAAYGKPTYYDQIRPLVAVRKGRLVVDQSYFNFSRPTQMPFGSKLVELLGPPRPFDRSFAIQADEKGEVAVHEDDRRHADIAASIQKVTEDVILEYVAGACAKTGIKDVAMAGGVALNSLANGRIQRELGVNLYIHPAAGDAGSAIGAALMQYHLVLGLPRTGPLKHAYLGKRYSAEETRAAFQRYSIEDYREFGSDEELVAHVAAILRERKVVGWMQGRFEWGPRALGNRSILASPLDREMQNIVNRTIKYREPFRPFAPAVTREAAADFFDFARQDHTCRPEEFMLSICNVPEAAKRKIPAVTHVDGTARVQFVTRDSNPTFYALLQKFGELTGVPVLMNTSFNLKSEPVVCSPADAIKTFLWSELDCLVIDRFVVEKRLEISVAGARQGAPFLRRS